MHRSRAKIDGGVDGQRHREGSGRRAHRIVPGGGSVGGGSAGAETGLGDEHPARRHEAHLHHLPSAQLRRDECAPVLRGVFDRFQAGLRYVWCGCASRMHLLVPSSCVLRSTVPSIRWISGGRRVPCWEPASAVTAPGASRGASPSGISSAGWRPSCSPPECGNLHSICVTQVTQRTSRSFASRRVPRICNRASAQANIMADCYHARSDARGPRSSRARDREPTDRCGTPLRSG